MKIIPPSGMSAASTDTLTNKTFDANGTGNSLSNVDIADLANGTDGELITWDSAGAPAVVAVGTATHVLTSNGAGSAPTFQAAAGGSGALTREGGQTTEATTTSTSAVDLLSLTSLTIAAADVAMMVGATRKTSGAADDAGIGFKENTTVIQEAVAANVQIARLNTINIAMNIMFFQVWAPRVTNYTDGASGGYYVGYDSNLAIRGNAIAPATTTGAAAHLTAEITQIVLRGITDNASNTLGADETHIYSLAIS